MAPDKSIEIARDNIRRTLMDGPRLRYGTGLFVGGIRGEDQNEEVLLCGLGGMGVGSEWCRGIEYRKYPGYEMAKAGWRFSFWDGWTKKFDGGVTVSGNSQPPTKEEACAVMAAYLGSVHGPGKKWHCVVENND